MTHVASAATERLHRHDRGVHDARKSGEPEAAEIGLRVSRRFQQEDGQRRETSVTADGVGSAICSGVRPAWRCLATRIVAPGAADKIVVTIDYSARLSSRSMLFTPSTPCAYPQVLSRRFACLRVVRPAVSAGDGDTCRYPSPSCRACPTGVPICLSALAFSAPHNSVARSHHRRRQTGSTHQMS